MNKVIALAVHVSKWLWPSAITLVETGMFTLPWETRNYVGPWLVALLWGDLIPAFVRLYPGMVSADGYGLEHPPVHQSTARISGPHPHPAITHL